MRKILFTLTSLAALTTSIGSISRADYPATMGSYVCQNPKGRLVIAEGKIIYCNNQLEDSGLQEDTYDSSLSGRDVFKFVDANRATVGQLTVSNLGQASQPSGQLSLKNETYSCQMRTEIVSTIIEQDGRYVHPLTGTAVARFCAQ